MRSRYWVVLLVLTLVVPSPVQAQKIITSDTIQNGGTLVVSPAGQLTISDPVNNPLLTLTSGANTSGVQYLAVGSGINEHGRLRLEGGSTLNSGYGNVGYDSGTGTLTVSGADSQWKNNYVLNIGYFKGTGTLTIENGGVVMSGDSNMGSVNSTGSATVTGSGSKWQNSESLIVGDHGTGKLTVEKGATVTSFEGILGNFGTGTAIVTGTNSQWQSSGILVVGLEGTGILTVENGGVVTSGIGIINSFIKGSQSNSNGTVVISGVGSQWKNADSMYIHSAAELNVEAGGIVSNKIGYLEGAAAITGAGSHWQNGGDLSLESGSSLNVSDGGEVTIGQTLFTSISNLSGNGTISANGAILDADLVFDSGSQQVQPFGTGGQLTIGPGDIGVGYRTAGTIAISNGTQLESANGYVGYNTNTSGTATVSGAGSVWHSSNLFIGPSGTGTLTVENGGLVTNRNGYVGYYGDFDGNGTMKVTGPGSRWENNFNLIIGDVYGKGTLTIENGGVVTSSYGVLAYSGATTVTGVGSQWLNSGKMRVGVEGKGILTVQDGGIVEIGDVLKLGTVGTLTGNGGTIVGNVVNEGLIAPGNSPGVLTIDGDLTTTGIVKFELAGTGSGLFDQLLVTGELDLGGIVEIDLINGFNPVSHNSFKVLDFAKFNDAGYVFDFSHSVLGAGLSWDTSTFEVDGTIRVVPETSSIILAGMAAISGLIVWRKK